MSALSEFLKKNGRAPQVSLVITPLDKSRKQINLTQFVSYQFTTSILIPVDQFQFTFTLPDVAGGIDKYINEGDVAELYAGTGVTVNTSAQGPVKTESLICTGIIDVIDVESTMDGGDLVTVTGRNLLGQLEDNNAVNLQNKCIWGIDVPVTTAAGTIIQGTRIRGLIAQDAPSGSNLFATEPGESKLSAILRYIEPLNCVIWSDPSGYMKIGRPNMSQAPMGRLVCGRSSRFSNVNSMKVVRSSTQIPNTIISVWTGQESVVNRVSIDQVFNNPASGPSTLRGFGHKVQRTIVTSTPEGSNPQALSDANKLRLAGNTLQNYAVRELAKENIKEIQVQANVKSHFNDDLTPFLIDQVYQVTYERGGVSEAMYVYQVEYSMDAEKGPRTAIYLCRKGCIVGGSSKGAVNTVITNSSQLQTL